MTSLHDGAPPLCQHIIASAIFTVKDTPCGRQTRTWPCQVSTLSAIAGILIALDVDMTPTFGFNYFLYGGVGNYRGLIFGSLLLASAQHLAAYYIDTKWMETMAYRILILFLIGKPLGFSGLRLKKVEV
jgi:branched-subunit amino acid ABC-type transport system permease component